MATIMYTRTDEAPLLATYSFLPIVQGFCAPAGVEVTLRDISLAGRILALFPEYLAEEQRVEDALTSLGELAKTPEANIIKLPNISASRPQLTAAIAELQSKGFAVPDYPENPVTDDEKSVRARYDAVKGSAVNPVLREGNSDRRAPLAVKNYAKKHPHSMGAWSPDSKTNVATMGRDDFRTNEQSVICPGDGTLTVRLVTDAGTTELKKVKVLAGEVVDATVLRVKALDEFLAAQIKRAKEEDVLFSVHLKATMMKVSDPIIFGHVVRAFLPRTFERYGEQLRAAGLNGNNGLGAIYAGLADLPDGDAVKASIEAELAEGPRLAMVNSDKGITNLHVPSDVIIDASMPAAIRAGGKMYGRDGKLQDMKAVIPDRSYARIYQATIDFCKENGAFDPRTMGSVSNIGLMAQKAEEYGSHDKTFEIQGDGFVRVIDAAGKVLIEHAVEKGDIWRMCQTKDLPIRDWVKLAVTRARITNTPAYFWLDEDRGHDKSLIGKVQKYLKDHDTKGLDIQILPPRKAIVASMKRSKEGKDTISVTGNVLRDYLTDLFPILELGTSAKMLSIVPLLNGGGLYETGAGGSAPKHVQQFVAEGHLRWDSLGEFLALGVSLEDYGRRNNNAGATVLAKALNDAIGKLLDANVAPARDAASGIDNRGTHVALDRAGAETMAAQKGDAMLQAKFAGAAKKLAENEKQILAEIDATRGKPIDIGGYYQPDQAKLAAAMRPSKAFNAILDELVPA